MTLLPLTQVITYWPQTSSDKNGDPTFGAGVSTSARWVRKEGKVTDAKGNEINTEFVIYTTVSIPRLSMAVLEDQDAVADPIDGARIMIMATDNPSLTNLIKYVM